jgi:flagellar FliL protein
MTKYLIKLSLLFIVSFSFFSPVTWAADDEEAAPVPIYFKFSEPFTINFQHQSNQQVRYLQIKVTLMSFDQEVITNSELNEPMLQDALRTLFTDQTMETVTTVEGRKLLQTAALDTVKTILKDETSNDDVESVYFTSFILQ